jgi:hypothetical protein
LNIITSGTKIQEAISDSPSALVFLFVLTFISDGKIQIGIEVPGDIWIISR